MSQVAYDPEADPRWIPPPGGREVGPAYDEQKFQELLTAQKVWDTLLGLFDSPGWHEFVKVIEHDRDGIDQQLIREKDPMEWKVLRGQLEHANWVLALPQEAARKYAVVMGQIAEATKEGADG